MFAKRLLQKAIHHHRRHHLENESGGMTSADVDVRTIMHYGIPSTASIIAFDPIQRLLAIGTSDGRIKLMGGDNIEALLISPKQMPFKYFEFLYNEGFLISITNDNEIQVWNLESRCIGSTLQWESNITAFSIVIGSHFMYVGDEYGLISVLKYDAENGELLQMPYNIDSGSLQEAAGRPFLSSQLIVGVLPQPCSSGSRVVIAYVSGLIILWNIVEARIISQWGNRILQLKDNVGSSRDTETSLEDNKHDPLEEKEISSICWASSDGSILAVGYVDGDILFWRASEAATGKNQQAVLSREVVKLQLSSAEKRLPIIALQWWGVEKSRHDGDGQLFIYGGDEIGGDEAVTVLGVEWSSGLENLKCHGRVDLKLGGSFADAILIPTSGTTGRYENAAIFVLTNPGKLQVFDYASISASMLQKEKNLFVSSVDFPAVIPTIDPCMTVAKFCCLPIDGDLSKALLEIAAIKKLIATSNLPRDSKMWSLTGGVSNHFLISKDKRIERVYVAGYEDGSVRIWDATYPVLSLLCVLGSEQVKGINISGSGAPVSKVDLCSHTLTLAVANARGLVYLHSFSSSDETGFHFVAQNRKEVHSISQGKGPNCRAVFGLLDSKIQALEFTSTGAKLVVGYECARIAVLDTKSLSTMFLMDNLSSSTSPLVSVVCKDLLQCGFRMLTHAGEKIPDDCVEEYIFILTDDATVYAVNGNAGNMISSRPIHLKEKSACISIHIVESSTAVARRLDENLAQHTSSDNVVGDEPPRDIASESPKSETGCCSSEYNVSAECLMDSYLLLCCRSAVRVFTLKSVIQGDSKSICKIRLVKACCWTTTFTRDEKNRGLVLFYQTGDIEIRSLPYLELVKEFSLMSTLRWNFSANMEKTASSTSNGHMILVHEREVALISILASGNDFRIPESLPCLHDGVLAAAAVAAKSLSSSHKKKQRTGTGGIFSGIIKGLKGGKLNNAFDQAPTFSHLDSIFMKNPSPTFTNKQENANLRIDDIEIDDEPVPLTSTSSRGSHQIQDSGKEKKSERKKLLNDGGTETKPRMRTPEEIIATYRRTEDASSAAGLARNKLLERQEKLERISKRTAELQSGAEDFASLANELVKAMENRKWWQI